MADQGDEKQWVQVQKKTFTKWLNNHLKKKGFPPMEDVTTEFDNGIRLMQVVNALYDITIPKHNPAPKMRPMQMDNLQLAFNMVEEAKIKTNFLKTTHLADHDEKMILGMIWAIILDYAIKGISVDELTAKEGLLLWVQKKTKGYREVDPPGVKNFHTHWKNGMALSALIHRHRPNLIDYDALDPANAAENLENAFKIAEEQLDIPRLLDVEDLTQVVRPDERSVMTYVSEFFHRFASESVKETAAQRLQNFIAFMRGIEAQEDEYARRARGLIAWTQEQGSQFQEAKFGDTAQEAAASLKDFRDYLTERKPLQLGEKVDVESLFAEIQTELAVNERAPYVPPEDCSPDAVTAAFEALASVESGYAKGCRDNRFRFVEKMEVEVSEEKKAEILAAYEHFDKSKDGLLQPLEFKAACQAMGIPFKDEAAFNKVFNDVSGGNDFISKEQYIQYNMRLNEYNDSPDQVKANFAIMADDNGTITADQLNMPPLSAEDLEYLKTHMTSADGANYDYNAYVDATFTKQ